MMPFAYGGAAKSAFLLSRIYHRYRETDPAFDTIVIVGAIVGWIIFLIVDTVSWENFKTKHLLGETVKKEDRLPKPTKVISNADIHIKPEYVRLENLGFYIQNNTYHIENFINLFTPGFKHENFIAFAKDVFVRFAKVRDPSKMQGLVAFDADAVCLPDEIESFGVSYLHNYIMHDKRESLKVLFTVITTGNDIVEGEREKFFVTFTRNNPYINVKGGQFASLNCPKCGGEITFDKEDEDEKDFNVCPYCGNTVTFAEGDWQLAFVELITGDTLICSWPVIKSY